MNGWVLSSWLWFLPAFISTIVFYTLSQVQAFGESDGWKRKYREPFEPAPNTWYYQFFKLKYRERFPLSGSLLVSFTDKYHAFQFGFKASLCASIVLYRPLFWWDPLVLFALWGVVFTIAYSIFAR
jgi:hypothetical protein